MLITIFFENFIVLPQQRSLPPKKDRVARLHYITRQLRNRCHHILTPMLSHHETYEYSEHFNMKRWRRPNSNDVYGMSKFNLSRILWNFEICYFWLRMLSSSFSFFFFFIQRFLWVVFKVFPILLEASNLLYRFLTTFSMWRLSKFFPYF